MNETMFGLSIDKNIIRISENGNEHEIPLDLEYWSNNDLLKHWGYESYELLDGYALKFLLTSMVSPGSQSHVRAFRTVRTRDKIHFDDVLIQSPWRISSWNPTDIIDYLSSPEYQMVYDYPFSLPGRVPEFTISVEEFDQWHNGALSESIDDNYDSNYELSTGGKII